MRRRGGLEAATLFRVMRQRCDECGSDRIEHGTLGGLSERYPDRAGDLAEGAAWMLAGPNASAWVCLACPNLARR